MKKLFVIWLILGLAVFTGRAFGQDTQKNDDNRKGGFAVGGYDQSRKAAATKKSVQLRGIEKETETDKAAEEGVKQNAPMPETKPLPAPAPAPAAAPAKQAKTAPAPATQVKKVTEQYKGTSTVKPGNTNVQNKTAPAVKSQGQTLPASQQYKPKPKTDSIPKVK